ncbi:MAG: ABC transporter permease subunit [Anaerolineae bacterium]|nr:ABC transporter permease subunit [Anaerolineae bacterium]NIN95244.1 ABC transporter permease subunit [Anaerolineae bacterium]NIQ78213.1 ABC transporter permease subunit [Anaerolineae bacterium]
MKPMTFWQRLSRAVQGPYFIIGSVLVILLVLMAFLGPEVAPHNPYQVKRLQWIDGELHKAPFPPSDLYPLGTDDQGRDQLSLLLYGAGVTLVLAFVATVVRLLLGLILGTITGWWPGSLFDRAVTAITELLAAIPGLILAMLVVFAVGVRRGQVAFIAALSLVGWGEVAQIVRGHVLTIRNRLYIMAARAVGLSPANILSRHVLPNLLPTLLALAALEMGAALLLLGELGFVQLFIGGGRTGFDMATWEVHHYFDVPDWGAMLGSSWRWFRSYPWFPMAPALAFFVAILGFNLFGYGLQRFLERGRFHPSGWSVLRFLLAVALLLLGARALLQNSGIEAQFAQLTDQFNVERAWDDIAYLSQPELEGRPTGSDGGVKAADYIASQFEQAGLTPITPDGSYFHPYTAIRGRITTAPVLEVLDADGEPQIWVTDGVSFDPWQAFHAEGSIDAELVVASTGSREAVIGLEGAVLLVLDPQADVYNPWTGYMPFEVVFRLVPDEELAQDGIPPPFEQTSYATATHLPSFPNLLIGESTARQILAQVGVDLEELKAAMKAGEQVILHTGLQVRVTYGLVYEEVPANSVVGYIAGLDMERRGERILVAATYTWPPSQDGSIFPGADENASGIALMLETARLLQDLGFVPKRTVVFAAFDEMGGSEFVTSPALPTRRSDIWTVVILDGVGAGGPILARLEAGPGLARAFEQSARRFGVRTEELDEWNFFFISNSSRLRQGDPRPHDSYQGLVVTRPGDDLSGTIADTLDHLDSKLLEEAGQVVAHFVMVLSSR